MARTLAAFMYLVLFFGGIIFDVDLSGFLHGNLGCRFNLAHANSPPCSFYRMLCYNYYIISEYTDDVKEGY